VFCSNCGNEIADNAALCVNCGCRINENKQSGKSWVITLLLCFFWGALGIHRFYVGKIASGRTMLILTVFLFWLIIPVIITVIWAFIDFLNICFGDFKDCSGNELVK